MHLHGPVAFISIRAVRLVLLACVLLPADSPRSPLGLGLLLPYGERLVPAAGAARRHSAACVVLRRCFGLQLELQLIQACFDKVKCVCCEKHLHSKL